MNETEEDSALAVSTAEYAMEHLGLRGDEWHVPRMRYDDPARVSVHQPVNAFIRGVLEQHGLDPEWAHGINVRPCCWELRETGAGQAITDGLNYIGLSGEDTNTMTLLHECAHILMRDQDEHHGPRFQAIAEQLYRDHISPEAGSAFRTHLDGAKRIIGVTDLAEG